MVINLERENEPLMFISTPTVIRKESVNNRKTTKSIDEEILNKVNDAVLKYDCRVIKLSKIVLFDGNVIEGIIIKFTNNQVLIKLNEATLEVDIMKIKEINYIEI